jgi:hypothetical protein
MGYAACMGTIKIANKVLARKSQEKSPLGSSRELK